MYYFSLNFTDTPNLLNYRSVEILDGVGVMKAIARILKLCEK